MVSERGYIARRGWNPCIVCREPCSGAKGQTACPECHRKVAEYDAMREKLHAGQVEISLRNYPYVPGADFHRKNRRGALDVLLASLRKIFPRTGWNMQADAAPRFEGSITDPVNFLTNHSDMGRYNVPAPMAQFLVDLEHRIYEAMNEAHADGVKEGTNLLAQLAAGHLTTDDFEKKAGIQR